MMKLIEGFSVRSTHCTAFLALTMVIKYSIKKHALKSITNAAINTPLS